MSKGSSSKNIIILDQDGGRLGNQLWNYISIYAYCLERGYTCENRSFFTYTRFFDLPLIHPVLDPLFARLPKRYQYQIYQAYRHFIKRRYSERIIESSNVIGQQTQKPFYLPPSDTRTEPQEMRLHALETSIETTWYFSGWLFRNPTGIQRYHHEIRTAFRPKAAFTQAAETKITELRSTYKTIVGVHIRLTDYREYANGQFFVSREEVQKILFHYLERTKKTANDVCFVICSDEPLSTSMFNDLHCCFGPGHLIQDWYLLSLTDTIIGSDSTYGLFAAYYGNIPFILFRRDTVLWDQLETGQFCYDQTGSLNLQP